MLKAPGLASLFVFALLASTVSALYASFQARDLDVDGSFYLLIALQKGGVAFVEPARKTVQFLQQSLSFTGFRLGLTDLPTYGRLLTLGMQGWPVALTGSAWFILPRESRGWVLGPLLNLAVVIPTTNFVGIGEGIIASCLMWILFSLVEFRVKRWQTGLLAVFVSAACFYLHEAAFPFMLGVAALAASKVRQAHGLVRLCLVLVAILALASSVHLLYRVIHPRDAIERAAFLKGALYGFLVAPGFGFNLPALAAIAVGLCLLLACFARAQAPEVRRRRLRLACTISAIGCGVAIVLFLVRPDWVTTPQTYFAARSLPITATTAMAAATYFLRQQGWRPAELGPPPVRWLLAVVIVLQLTAQTVMTSQWAAYRTDLAGLVASNQGLIDWSAASRAINPRQTAFRTYLMRLFSIQSLSIDLAPGGRVRSIVQPKPGIRWVAFDPTHPTTLPLCARGLDWSDYFRAVPFKGADPRAGCGRQAS